MNVQNKALFTYPIQAGESPGGIITLRAPIHVVVAHEIMCAYQMQGVRFYLHILCQASYILQLFTPNFVLILLRTHPRDGFAKQNEATHFVVRYTLHIPGVSTPFLRIETEVGQKNDHICC